MYQKFFPDINLNEIMDNYVQQYAIAEGKPVIGLETIEEQINILFNSSSLQDQADQLLVLLEDMEATHDMAIELINAYRNKDLVSIQTLMESANNPDGSSNEAMEALIKNRNDNWVKELPAIMQGKSSLVAVGAAHLAGDDGILSQLRELGYTVEPVK